MNNLKQTIIETKRLIIRPFKIDDAKLMYQNWATDENVTKYCLWDPHKDINETRQVITEWIEKMNDIDCYYQWVIESKETKDLIGNIACFENNEIGYCIAKKYWNQKYTSEALEAVLEFLFMKADFNELIASHNVENIYSGKVMLHCGMKFIKKQLSHEFNPPVMTNLYKITKEDYLNFISEYTK